MLGELAASREATESPPGALTTCLAASQVGPPSAAVVAGVHCAFRREGYEALRADAGEGLDVYAGATLDFGIRYERAVLDWFDHLSSELGGVAGEPEGRRT